MDLSELRQEYAGQPLDVDSVDPNPFQQFTAWFDQASTAELLEPNAMVLATVDANGRPSQRTVLLKYFDESGFVFFTNYGSRKAQQIAANAHVSLLFQWLPLHRQVEVEGVATKVSSAESLKYFLKRPRESQLGAWVSRQSEVVSHRQLLEAKLQEMKARFGKGEIPLPSFWGGYRIAPTRLEFWQGGPGRLHDRIEFRSDGRGGWDRNRLAP
ncbi:Pyridoxine/pyridoxamine 5'-phosphate oxidase [Rosistilla carotiformis]|uniref:Pyridoxine/pyridoxamine 5'-phosphate oxidase n=1 Tax=Rosistilla carotiformis TaxID=2528017 RepID=A0A518JPS6_9BACT|nr:pyridoxamine 5'-phosphate oxidase [Rosistilla carotiformis]QDV67547.1 Pyridoxine/pyridoxamine 5'-phosphate oxidase [Rosistilla carotiformis]